MCRCKSFLIAQLMFFSLTEDIYLFSNINSGRSFGFHFLPNVLYGCEFFHKSIKNIYVWN